MDKDTVASSIEAIKYSSESGEITPSSLASVLEDIVEYADPITLITMSDNFNSIL